MYVVFHWGYTKSSATNTEHAPQPKTFGVHSTTRRSAIIHTARLYGCTGYRSAQSATGEMGFEGRDGHLAEYGAVSLARWYC